MRIAQRLSQSSCVNEGTTSRACQESSQDKSPNVSFHPSHFQCFALAIFKNKIINFKMLLLNIQIFRWLYRSYFYIALLLRHENEDFSRSGSISKVLKMSTHSARQVASWIVTCCNARRGREQCWIRGRVCGDSVRVSAMYFSILALLY